MGGNVTATLKNGIQTKAQKIPLKEIGRSKFIAAIRDFLNQLNSKFEKEYNEKIWKNENEIISGFVFNGSTSFIMDPSLDDEEVVKYKQNVGDLDVTVPDYLKEKVWTFLDKLEGKQITKNVKYMGSNKPTIQSIGEQINAVFIIDFDGLKVPCQVDFEFLKYENDSPTEWAKFSHSSSFDDLKQNIKGVHHKYILRALIGGSSIRNDIVIATNKSTQDNIIISKSKINELPRMLKFSVGRGVRVAYEPMIGNDGKIIEYNGKKVYKEIPLTRSDFITSVQEIFKLTFGEVETKDLNKFYSFIGIVDLMKKYLNKEQIKNTISRYIDLLWATKPQRAQELEVQNPELDFQVKNSGYEYIINKLNIKNTVSKMINDYYSDYGHRKLKEHLNIRNSSLIDFINESKDMLDISILSADKYLTSDSKLEKFLTSHVTIEAKSDGVKLTVIKIADNGNIDDYIFAYKGNILYLNEFDYQPITKINSESIGASQFKLVFDHFESLRNNSIPVGTELQIEYLMSKPTLSSNYKYKHKMVLIGYSKSNYTISFGKIKTQNSGMKTENRDKYAKELNINVPLKLFDGILGTELTFERGILNNDLMQIYNKNKTSINWSDNKILYQTLKNIFLEVPSKFGGKEEGVVLKFDNNLILKWQQAYQLDQESRLMIKQKYREDSNDAETQYWNNVKAKAFEIIQGVKKSTNINKMLGDLSNVIRRLNIGFSHSKKTDAQIKDDIQLTAKTLLLKSVTGNNGCLIIGKFRVLTNGHYKLIQNAIKEYSKVAVCLISSKNLKNTADFRKSMLKEVFDDKIEIFEHSNGNIIRILDKIPFNINVVYAGSDRVLEYQRQIKDSIGLTVREMPRTSNDISATKVIENIDDYNFFKENTPRKIHQYYDQIKNIFEGQ